MSKYVPLHVQSHYSVLNAIPTINELVSEAQKQELDTLALTDFNNMFAVSEFRKVTSKAGIKPIFGVKIEIMQKSRFERREKDEYTPTLILLAQNYTGYQNLLKIITVAYDDGSFGRFQLDLTLLNEYSEHLIALSSDQTGILYQAVKQKNYEDFQKSVSEYQNIFGVENFYIEVQSYPTQEHQVYNKTLIEFAQKINVPMVASNPIKYLDTDDKILLDIISCIREKDTLSSKNHSVSSEFGNSFSNNYSVSKGYEYFKSVQEMEELFINLPEALENSKIIADRCNVEFPPVEDQSPPYPIPENKTPEEFLRQKSFHELALKFEGNIPIEYQKRLEWELDTVCSMGFPNYFLVVSDFVQYAKNQGILVGPGRGSAAGALLSYAVDITSVDPMKYDLLFERFLNPERISMPDIDIDFEDSRRDEVKEYLRTRYGISKTADVITFGYNKAKAVLKDVGRVLEIPLARVNQITGLVDANTNLEDQVNSISALKEITEHGTTQEKEWIRFSIKLANRIRNLGSHASALIIAGNVLSDIIPLYKDRNNTMVTQFEGKYLEENGLLKMDILGLSNLTIIKECCERIYKNYQIQIEIEHIPLDDQKVYQMFGDGHTAGIFQFESVGMTEYLKSLKPTSIEDLIAMNALYRPGPMDNIPSFIERKQGREEVDCFHQNLEPVLKNTYGIIVYQEQVMQIAQILSGFSLGEADMVRRIMAKKKPDELDAVRPKWVQGAVDQGYEASLAEKLFELLIPFSNYAFNKSHAAAYSILAYQIAWLKTHYMPEFMASLMSSNMGKHEDIAKYITEIKKSGIPLLTPDINKSFFKFEVEIQNNIPSIRYGLGAVKGLGEQAVEEIIRERTWGGHFSSVEDFIERTAESSEVRKNSTEILLKAGAFDSILNENDLMKEKAIYLNPGNLSSLYQKYEKKEAEEQIFSLFSTEEIEAASTNILQKNLPPISFEEEFQNEIKVFGFYLTGKLFQTIEKQIGKISTYTEDIGQLLPIGTNFSMIGYVTEIFIHPKKNWGRFILNTQNEAVTFFLFGEKFDRFQGSIRDGDFIYLKGQITERPKDKNRSIEMDNFMILKGNNKPIHGELHIMLENQDVTETLKNILVQLKNTAQKHYRDNAHHTITFYIKDNTSIRILKAGSAFRVHMPHPDTEIILSDSSILSYWVS